MWPNDLNSLLFILKSFSGGQALSYEGRSQTSVATISAIEKGEDFNKRIAAHKKIA